MNLPYPRAHDPATRPVGDVLRRSTSTQRAVERALIVLEGAAASHLRRLPSARG